MRSISVVAILAVYSNHFHNSFHLDDSHTIEQNFYIRDLRNIPRFFADATTLSTLAANQTRRRSGSKSGGTVSLIPEMTY